MNVDEIGSAIDGLVNEFGLPTITLPNGTAEGAPSTGGQVGDVDTRSSTTSTSPPASTRASVADRTA